jgi:hypothetical protein
LDAKRGRSRKRFDRLVTAVFEQAVLQRGVLRGRAYALGPLVMEERPALLASGSSLVASQAWVKPQPERRRTAFGPLLPFRAQAGH